MRRVEGMLDIDDTTAATFRDEVMGMLANWSLDNPGKEIDYPTVFPKLLAEIKQAYFNERKEALGHLAQDCLKILSSEQRQERVERLHGDEKNARATIARFIKPRLSERGV